MTESHFGASYKRIEELGESQKPSRTSRNSLLRCCTFDDVVDLEQLEAYRLVNGIGGFGRLEGLISGRFAQKSRTNVVVVHELKEASLRNIPHLLGWHATKSALHLVTKVDLVDLKENMSNIA